MTRVNGCDRLESHPVSLWNYFPPNAVSEQHCENYDVKQETVHCYPRNVDRCCTSFVNNVSICFPPRFDPFALLIEILGKQNSLFSTGPVFTRDKCSLFSPSAAILLIRYTSRKNMILPRVHMRFKLQPHGRLGLYADRLLSPSVTANDNWYTLYLPKWKQLL